MEERIDPFKNKERWVSWKERYKLGIPELSRENSDLILKYLRDMELGVNVSVASKKGARSPVRLNTVKNRIILLAKHFERLYSLTSLTNIKEEQLIEFFSNMRNGKLTKQNSKKYRSVRDYAKVFKAFWHWHQRVSKKQGIEIPDITTDLDTTGPKPKWVYLSENQIKLLCETASYEYKVLIWFLFDSGIRSPTELMNVKVNDLYNNCKELNIREEASKTFGRRIKLMLCSEILKDYIEKNNLNQEDYLFKRNPTSINRYLKRLGEKVFGDKESLAGKKYSQLTMYDFRHCSCCYWLPRYKSESALKFRFGWKKSDKIHYYSELLGMKDTISEEDLLIDLTKTEIEKRLIKAENKNRLLSDKLDAAINQIKQIGILTKQLYDNFGVVIREI